MNSGKFNAQNTTIFGERKLRFEKNESEEHSPDQKEGAMSERVHNVRSVIKVPKEFKLKNTFMTS